MLDRKVEAKEVEAFLYHLRNVICRGHGENYAYYLRWWVWFFRKGRTGIMVILLSEAKGTRKNILELLAEHVIGDEYVAVTDKIDTIVQRFNAVMVEKALIVANELKEVSKSPEESSRVEEVLKMLVKDHTTAISRKRESTPSSSQV